LIDFGKLEKSLRHLEMQCENYESAERRPELTQLDREALAESVIQRFETCYDMLWKHLKRYLIRELGIPDVPASPKPVFRIAAENRLLPGSVDRWLEYADARTSTAHDYSGEKAAECLKLVPDFVRDANALYRTLTERPIE
jgi:nucleotidyltransferase substrate binding protein (TIGR01987 family)